jgi:hypothetical protein
MTGLQQNLDFVCCGPNFPTEVTWPRHSAVVFWRRSLEQTVKDSVKGRAQRAEGSLDGFLAPSASFAEKRRLVDQARKIAPVRVTRSLCVCGFWDRGLKNPGGQAVRDIAKTTKILVDGLIQMS